MSHTKYRIYTYTIEDTELLRNRLLRAGYQEDYYESVTPKGFLVWTIIRKFMIITTSELLDDSNFKRVSKETMTKFLRRTS